MVQAGSNGKAVAGSPALAGGSGHEHFVQFYESDGFLLNSLSGFIGAGLGAGEACVVLAGRARRERLEERLRASGVDVARAAALGQYVSLDARETLALFTVDGEPEPRRFAEVVGGVLARAGAGGRRVRVFGDMVAHLCDESRHPAAVRLERLWNDLLKTHPCSLFCAYPVSNFGSSALAATFGEVCAEHARVAPAESYAALADPAERLRAVALLQQKANSLAAEVAERRQAEEALRAVKEELEVQLRREQAARAEAETANRLKDEFLATVSHELRTPLTAILGWTHVLRAGQLGPEAAARALEIVERNARAQNQLIEDLLDMSRIITGKLRLDPRPLDPAAFVVEAVEAMRPAAEAKGVTLVLAPGAGVGAVSGDADRLRQVVWNLLSNAIKFTPSGGRVEVRLESAGGQVEVAVSDTGAGIGAEFLPYVFDRFRQADGSTTRAHGGLGLGLAIVRHLVELHGGTVSAESGGEGQGATFTVRLPALRIADCGLRIAE
ncbi:MAG TPA: ATP-binding protein [Pyrinomonadaceae bacterium]|nr:ATP-binding protein [Pyrinomonadaceae bacterium]